MLEVAGDPTPRLAPIRTRPHGAAVERTTGIRVLLVDPYDAYRMLLDEVFGLHGINCQATASCTSALGLLLTFHPDVLVLDLGQEGAQSFIAAARQAHPRIAIVGVSASLGPSDYGANTSLMKPCRTDDIVAAIAAVSKATPD